MSLTLRSSSNLFNENERLRRKRLTITTLNRFLSFNENKSSAVENRRRLLQKSAQPNLIELLEEDDDDIDDNQGLCHECDTCSKIFASEYGLNYHINMHHPSQSILCSICHLTFRSHRSLKTHQQRRHSNQQTKSLTNHNSLPNYSYLSSYLVLAFSSNQFPILAKIACEQHRLPLGDFSSTIFKCSSCSISFPCQRTLTYHVLDQHEQYQFKICQELISNLIERIEYNQRTVTDDDIDSIRYNLSRQASHFGLVNKRLANQIKTYKTEQNRLIYPVCQHEKRTCANLCLEHLSTYDQLVRNYSYKIPIIPKGSLFSQGSIVSVPSINTIHSLNSLKTNDSNESMSNSRQKRKNFKQNDELTVQIKRRSLSNVTTSSRTNRTNANNKIVNGKQQTEHTIKTNDSKSFSIDQSSSAQRKLLSKDDYTRSSSMSSNSSTSTRSSIPKSSTNFISHRLSKRSLSPSIPNPSEKRRGVRDRRSKTPSSTAAAVIRIDDELDIEQENGDDDDEDEDDEDNDTDGDITPIKFERSKSSQRSSKQRQASSGSIEYVQTLSNDQQLNNIENFKSKSSDEEIMICRSPPSVKKALPTPNKNHSKASVNGTKKSNGQQSPTTDEQVRVRCKICGEILEGRSRFSKHVISMHPNLLKKNLPDTKPQPTAIVR